MPDDEHRILVVKCTAGVEELFTVAATALACGAKVSLWLTGEASWLATPGRAEAIELAHSAPIADLRDALLEAHAVTVCTQCAARRGIGEADLLPGARIAGSASFVDEILQPGVQALVY
jgi:predicted peroxiredoxin